ncbi:lipoprotein signal peptidase [Calothrix sp. NIES-4101]|nr:lipoprotein signal peptidase [Calothrix sp. NIES-4101]
MQIKNRQFWIAALIAFFLDQITKYWVLQSFQLRQTRPLIEGVFHFTYVRNYGAAFNILDGQVDSLKWLSLFVSLGLVGLAVFAPELEFWERLGYGFILGGAMGNGIDRFVLGYVVDFLDFRLINFPVFNFADVFINIGIACLLIGSFQKNPTTNRRSR